MQRTGDEKEVNPKCLKGRMLGSGKDEPDYLNRPS